MKGRHHFGPNVLSIKEEEHETNVTYICGCIYNITHSSGFDHFCKEHNEEANTFHMQSRMLCNERDDHCEDSERVNDVNGRIYIMAGKRAMFYAKIKGLVNTFWLIHDYGDPSGADEAISCLVYEGIVTIVNCRREMDTYYSAEIKTIYDQCKLFIAFERLDVTFRFTTEEGIDEYQRGFHKGMESKKS